MSFTSDCEVLSVWGLSFVEKGRSLHHCDSIEGHKYHSISIYIPWYSHQIPGQIPGQIPMENPRRNGALRALRALRRLQEGPLQLLTRDVLRIVDTWRASNALAPCPAFRGLSGPFGVSWCWEIFGGRNPKESLKWPRKLMKIALMSVGSMLEVIPMLIARENQTPHAKFIHGMWHVMNGPSPSSIWILGRCGRRVQPWNQTG